MSWKTGLGAALSGYMQGRNDFLDRQQQEKEALAKATLEEISRNMDTEKFNLMKDEFDWKKQMDLEELAIKKAKKSGGEVVSGGSYKYFKPTKDGGWTENSLGGEALDTLNLLGKNANVKDLPPRVYEYLQEKKNIFGNQVLPDNLTPAYKKQAEKEFYSQPDVVTGSLGNDRKAMYDKLREQTNYVPDLKAAGFTDEEIAQWK